MPRVQREAQVTWEGNVARGSGSISGATGAFAKAGGASIIAFCTLLACAGGGTKALAFTGLACGTSTAAGASTFGATGCGITCVFMTGIGSWGAGGAAFAGGTTARIDSLATPPERSFTSRSNSILSAVD